jgi:hypothetical protein
VNNFPIPPAQPIYKSTSHTLHLILSILTVGVWPVFVWMSMSFITNSSNQCKRRRYQKEMAHYEQERWAWDQAHRAPPQPQY